MLEDWNVERLEGCKVVLIGKCFGDGTVAPCGLLTKPSSIKQAAK